MPTKTEIAEWQAVVGAKADGDFGPRTVAATIAWARDHGHLRPLLITEAARSRVVAIAEAEIGESRALPPPPYKYYLTAAPMYMNTSPNEKAWCGVFALWCLRQAGLTNATWKDGVGFAGPLGLPIVPLPQPGDIAYFARLQHYAIVKSCAAGFVDTIDGNTMPAPAEGVTARRYRIVDVTAFYSIRNLVAANG